MTKLKLKLKKAIPVKASSNEILTGWRVDKATKKQLDAIFNMSNALNWKNTKPKTKGEACDLISKMAKEIQNRLSATGYMRDYRSSYNPSHDGWSDDYPDYDEHDYPDWM